MNGNEDLKYAYGELGEAAANLSFAGHDNLSKRVRDLQSEVGELVHWLGGGEE